MARSVGTMALAKQLGARIRRLRQTENLTQVEVADRTCLTQGFITLVESGRRLPSLGVLVTLAGAFQRDLCELFVSVDDPREELLDAIRRKDWNAVDTALVRLGRPARSIT